MRALASLQRIIDLQPIPNADVIEVATVLGWHVVVKKGDFKVGDPCLYFEIDSFLPIRQEWAFLQNSGIRKMLVDGKEQTGYRLKTVKLRGQISQGLALPINILQAWLPVGSIPKEGTDLTELLGVIKYEIPLPAQLVGKVRGNFPGFLPKTDESRIQAFPQIIQRYQGIPFYVTEKIDGSSCSFTIKNDEFHVCSRNLDLLDDGKNTIWRLAKELDIEAILRKMNTSQGLECYAIQGEVYGENIQSNPLRINGQRIAFFNIFDFTKGRFMDYSTFKGVTDLYGIPTVPIESEEFYLPTTVDQLVGYILDRRSMLNPDVMPEGFVFRPLEERQDEDLGRLSFKCINPEYLLKYE